MPAPRVQLFLSAVTAEFGSYRETLRHHLARPNVTVKVQEDFIAAGTPTLDKLDDYVQACEAVIHLAGDMTGAVARPPAVAALVARHPDLADRQPPLREAIEAGAPALSYTQWEAYLAVYHRKVLLIATPEPAAPRDPAFRADDAQRAAQREHLARLRALGYYAEITFANADLLAVEVLRSQFHDILARAGGPTKPVVLPYPSLGPLFTGREEFLGRLRASLERAPAGHATAIAGKVLHGLGGVGKTRLAVEYAWQQTADYKALLLIMAESPEALRRNLAALCEKGALDLPELEAPEEGLRAAAAIRWLQEHPGWLLILDNVDTEDAAAAAEGLLKELRGGHVLLTGRLASWSGRVEALELDVLTLTDAAAFLLARTENRRRRGVDDETLARTLAEELGGLALALEQAGAYIAHRRLTLAGYLEEWRDQSNRLLEWHDERLMQYPRSVAVTWRTSFDQLSESAQNLLDRVAWLAPESIPESLLAVPLPSNADESATEETLGSKVTADARDCLVELATFSLVAKAAAWPVFTVHRLVQEVTRQNQRGSPHPRSLSEALRWRDAAFIGHPQDVSTWPTLDPLLPHVRVVCDHADRAGIAEPTARLMNEVGLLLKTKARYAEAEPFTRRSLEILEKHYGVGHSRTASGLNNLARLLQETNRISEAEPLMRRSLAIDERSLGPNHPTVAVRLNNLALLLQSSSRPNEAEPLLRRALMIDERYYGSVHPDVAARFNNLGELLKVLGRNSEAEALLRRALAIDEQVFGSKHPSVARGLNNLGTLLRETNRRDEGESLMRRALKIVEQTYGTEHPRVAICLNNLALSARDAGRVEEAFSLMRRSLKIDEKRFGPNHPVVATRLNNLGILLMTTRNLREAEPLLRRALAIDEQSYGQHHRDVGRDLNNLAELLSKENRKAEAVPLLKRALAIFEVSLGTDHPRTEIVRGNLALLHHHPTRKTSTRSPDDGS